MQSRPQRHQFHRQGTAELNSWTKALAAMTEKKSTSWWPKASIQEIRHEVEKRELQHGDDHREQHGRKVASRKLELLRERVDLAIDKRAPTLDLSGRDTNALEPIDDAMATRVTVLGMSATAKMPSKMQQCPPKLKTHSASWSP